MPTSTAILRVCSGSLAATRKGHSRARHFGTTFRSWCKIFFACGGHQMNFLSRLGPGSSPGRAESQLASELGELPLLGRRREVVQQLPWPSAAATATGPMLLAAGELQVCSWQAQRAPAQLCRRHGDSSRVAAEDNPAAAVPAPSLSSVLLLSVGRVSSVSGVQCTHTLSLKNCVKCPIVVAGPGRPETILFS